MPRRKLPVLGTNSKILAHVEMTGMATSVNCSLLTINSAPLKKVATAVPSKIGPAIPLIIRNT